MRTIAVTIYNHENQKQAAQTNRDKQPSKDSVKEPEPQANTAQENDTKEPEPTASGTTDAENDGQTTPDMAGATVQKNDTKEPEPTASGTTDAENMEQPIKEPVDSTEPEVIQDETDLQEVPAPCNFIIKDNRLGEGGPKAKFGMNLEAITVLKKVESGNRPATSDEQQILSRYVGWGGVPDAFEPDKAGWEKEYQELKAALTLEEYDSAKSSVLNAHYTSPTVIKAIYKAVSSMGFTYGRILEPAALGTSLVYCQKRCQNPNFTEWSWTASAGALRSCFTPMRGFISPDMRMRASRRTSLTLPSGMCRSVSTRSTTQSITGWASLSITTSWRKP